MRNGQLGSDMDVKITTEVAGRICAVSVSAGERVESGADIVVVEAMKMEIPIPSPVAGHIKSILVNIDDVVAEGQTIAMIEA